MNRIPVNRRRLVILTSAVLLAAAADAGATLLVRKSLSELTVASSDVVHGTVHSVGSRWSDDGTRIETEVRIGIEEIFKGKPGKVGREVVVLVPGGRIGDLAMVVAGAPAFRFREEVLVFLKRDSRGEFRVMSLAMGKYRFERDDAGRLWISNPDYPLGRLLPKRAASIDARGRLPWSVVRAEIEGTVKGGGK